MTLLVIITLSALVSAISASLLETGRRKERSRRTRVLGWIGLGASVVTLVGGFVATYHHGVEEARLKARAEEIEADVTGGNSAAYVVFHCPDERKSDLICPMVYAIGRYPAYDVVITLDDPVLSSGDSQNNTDPESQHANDPEWGVRYINNNTFHVGTIVPNIDWRRISALKYPDHKPRRLEFQIHQRNGMIFQGVTIRFNGERWIFSDEQFFSWFIRPMTPPWDMYAWPIRPLSREQQGLPEP